MVMPSPIGNNQVADVNVPANQAGYSRSSEDEKESVVLFPPAT